jgi:uncharacterized membrane protein (UPF0127 family)
MNPPVRDTMSATVLKAFNQTRGVVVCARLESAGGMAGKSRGLLGRNGLDAGSGMLFEAGRLEPFMWMHMFFMRFPIDIIFLDHEGRVMHISHALRPWRVLAPVWGAKQALELAAGAARQTGTQIGDVIRVEPA